MHERLPLTTAQRVYAHALVAFLGRVVAHPELAECMVDGTRRLRDYLAEQLRRGQQTGQVSALIDPDLAADGLLALADGLASRLLQNFHTAAEAQAVAAEYLDHLFDRR